MKSLLRTINIVLLLSLSLVARSQVYPVFNGLSTIAIYPFPFNPLSTSYDTTGATLWKIGSTTKPFFALGGAPSNSIMTDTVNAYPVNANNAFVFKFYMSSLFNPILEINHKFQTTAHHDGCIVEFSADSGSTWQNVIGPCYAPSMYQSIHADNFYTPSDTLISGEPAFSGTSNGWVISRVQFFQVMPSEKSTSGIACHFPNQYSIVYVRFRFVSDSISDNLDGWIIQSIVQRQDDYGGSVAQINADNSLNIFPNPSASGKFTFPALTNQKDYTMYITDVLGRTVFNAAYTEQVDLSSCTQGVYFYRITNNIESYSGKLMKE